MVKIYIAELRALLDRTELFIKVFGSNEYFKIPNWLAEICDPENIRHSKLSAFIKPETTRYYDIRRFWGDKGPATGFKYKRPDEPAMYDPFLREKITFYPDPAVYGEPDTEEARRLRAEEIKRDYESLRMHQVKYNPLTSTVSVVPARLVRGMPRPGERFAKKQPMSLLPRHCRTEFYHRAAVTADLTFHVGFLFDKNRCDLKREQYFFAFDAWTWAQWWILPRGYARWDGQFIPVIERRFLPNFRNPDFIAHERATVLRPADTAAVQIDVANAEALPPATLAPTPRELPSDSSRNEAGWVPAIPLVVEGRPGATQDAIIAHREALMGIEALRAELAIPPTMPRSTLSHISPESAHSGLVTPRDMGYHLIFQSLGYAGLRDLINDIRSYVNYFLAAFHNPVNPQVNEIVTIIARKMIQLNRILLHNEVLVAPAPNAIVGICLIPSRPLPADFSFDSFRTPGTNAFKSYQEAVKQQQELSRLGGNRVSITLLDTFTGRLELLEEEIIEEVEFPDIQAPVPEPVLPLYPDPPETFPDLPRRQLHPPFPGCTECRAARSRSGGDVNALCIYHRGLQSRTGPPPRRR